MDENGPEPDMSRMLSRERCRDRACREPKGALASHHDCNSSAAPYWLDIGLPRSETRGPSFVARRECWEDDMRTSAIFGLAGLAFVAAGCEVSQTGTAGGGAQDPVERGRYLVTVAACTDCHTPGSFVGMPDTMRFLGGSEVGFEIPGLGVFHPPNLTPDAETGLGKWTEAQIVTAFTTGLRPDGRMLAPIMPWMQYANLAPEDAMAIAVYLKTLSPVVNKVPGPFGPNDPQTTLVMKVVAPPGANAPPGAAPP